MQASDGKESLETVSALMAELRADAKPLAQDMIRGMNAYRLLGVMSILLVIDCVYLALAVLFPQTFTVGLGNVILVGILLVDPVLGGFVGFRSLRRYTVLRRKYSKLIEISEKIGD